MFLIIHASQVPCGSVESERFTVTIMINRYKMSMSHDHGYVQFVVVTIQFSFMNYQWNFSTSNTTGATSGAGTA